MPTYLNCNFSFNLTYTSTQPAANAVYTDSAGTPFTIWSVVGVGSTIAVYYVQGYKTPILGTLTKSSGTGDATVVLNSFVNIPAQTVGDFRLEPGQVGAALAYIPSAVLPASVVQINTTPYLDMTIQSTAVSSSQTVTVPATFVDSQSGTTQNLLGNYRIRCYGASGAGSATIQLNNAGAVARQMGLYETYDIQCRERVVNSIIVTISSTFVLNVTIEKI